MIGGQAIATKISGDPVPSNNGIFYFYNDQLGSVTSMSNASNGAAIGGTISRYLPFGDWRTEPTAGLTDKGYTGHKHNNLGNGNNDIGLIYMNARFYVPGVGRFASADTIVPNPASPQSFNRFSYVLNSPIRLSDPSGHCGADNTVTKEVVGVDNHTVVRIEQDSTKNNQCNNIRTELEDLYGWIIEGEWFLADMETLQNAARMLEKWFASGGAFNPQQMVKNVFGGTVFKYAARLSGFRTGKPHLDKFGGIGFGECAQGGCHHVWGQTVVMLENFSLDDVIHELGHVLDNVMSGNTRLGGASVWGGGPSDIFADYIGATGHRNCTWRQDCKGIYSAPGWAASTSPNYYLEGSSEDFAQAFMESVLNPSNLRGQSQARWEYFNVLRTSLIDTYEYHR